MASANDYALNLLSARPYTKRNLRRKLEEKKFEIEEIATVIDRLTRAGYLDDVKFAAEFARQKLTTGGMSLRRVEYQLVAKGVSRGDARAGVESVLEEETIDLRRGIELAARKKAATMSGLEREVRERRLFAFLARRGFDIGAIRRVIADVLI